MFTSYTPPAVRILKSAKVQAFKAPIVAAPPDGFRGGVVLGDSVEERRLRHSRYGVPVDSFSADAGEYEKLYGEYTYFGPLYDHFGHTMSEFIHRAVPSITLAAFRKYLILADFRMNNPPYHDLPLFLKDILYFLGIEPDNVVIISRNSEIENLFVCEQGSDFGGGPKEGYLNYLDAFTGHRLNEIVGKTSPTLRTYVSRSKLHHGGNFLGERYFERLLEGEGYTIMHPQEMSLTDQMQMYRASKVLIFPEGSACHGLEFFGNNALKECHLMERRWTHRDIYDRIFRNRAEAMFVFAAGQKQQTCVVHPDTGQPLEHLDNTFIPPKALLDYFRSHNLARFSEFAHDTYNEIIMEDFDRNVAYHKESGSRMLSDDEILARRLVLDRDLASMNFLTG